MMIGPSQQSTGSMGDRPHNLGSSIQGTPTHTSRLTPTQSRDSFSTGLRTGDPTYRAWFEAIKINRCLSDFTVTEIPASISERTKGDIYSHSDGTFSVCAHDGALIHGLSKESAMRTVNDVMDEDWTHNTQYKSFTWPDGTRTFMSTDFEGDVFHSLSEIYLAEKRIGADDAAQKKSRVQKSSVSSRVSQAWRFFLGLTGVTASSTFHTTLPSLQECIPLHSPQTWIPLPPPPVDSCGALQRVDKKDPNYMSLDTKTKGYMVGDKKRDIQRGVFSTDDGRPYLKVGTKWIWNAELRRYSDIQSGHFKIINKTHYLVKGTLIDSDGTQYIGQYKVSKNGFLYLWKGEILENNGIRSKGTFKLFQDSNFLVSGIKRYPDGIVEVGNFTSTNGRAHLKSGYRITNTGVLDGDFRLVNSPCILVNGRIREFNGDVFEGTFSSVNGYNVLVEGSTTFANGDHFSGHFKHENGVHYLYNGTKRQSGFTTIGLFERVDGIVQFTEGTLIYPDGIIAKGTFREIQGYKHLTFGSYMLQDGTEYYGHFPIDFSLLLTPGLSTASTNFENFVGRITLPNGDTHYQGYSWIWFQDRLKLLSLGAALLGVGTWAGRTAFRHYSARKELLRLQAASEERKRALAAITKPTTSAAPDSAKAAQIRAQEAEESKILRFDSVKSACASFGITATRNKGGVSLQFPTPIEGSDVVILHVNGRPIFLNSTSRDLFKESITAFINHPKSTTFNIKDSLSNACWKTSVISAATSCKETITRATVDLYFLELLAEIKMQAELLKKQSRQKDIHRHLTHLLNTLSPISHSWILKTDGVETLSGVLTSKLEDLKDRLFSYSIATDLDLFSQLSTTPRHSSVGVTSGAGAGSSAGIVSGAASGSSAGVAAGGTSGSASGAGAGSSALSIQSTPSDSTVTLFTDIDSYQALIDALSNLESLTRDLTDFIKTASTYNSHAKSMKFQSDPIQALVKSSSSVLDRSFQANLAVLIDEYPAFILTGPSPSLSHAPGEPAARSVLSSDSSHSVSSMTSSALTSKIDSFASSLDIHDLDALSDDLHALLTLHFPFFLHMLTPATFTDDDLESAISSRKGRGFPTDCTVFVPHLHANKSKHYLQLTCDKLRSFGFSDLDTKDPHKIRIAEFIQSVIQELNQHSAGIPPIVLSSSKLDALLNYLHSRKELETNGPHIKLKIPVGLSYFLGDKRQFNSMYLAFYLFMLLDDPA